MKVSNILWIEISGFFFWLVSSWIFMKLREKNIQKKLYHFLLFYFDAFFLRIPYEELCLHFIFQFMVSHIVINVLEPNEINKNKNQSITGYILIFVNFHNLDRIIIIAIFLKKNFGYYQRILHTYSSYIFMTFLLFLWKFDELFTSCVAVISDSTHCLSSKTLY